MRKFCNQVVLENFFEPCVLYLLLEKPNYGYELSKNLKERCGCDVNIGNLYRGLSRMVKSGYIKKETSKSDAGPARIIYEITKSGRSYLASWIENLKLQNKTVSKLIKNYQKYYETN